MYKINLVLDRSNIESNIILEFIKKLKYNLIFFLFYRKQKKSSIFYKFLPKTILFAPKINLKKQLIEDDWDFLYFNYLNRLYFYSRGLKHRYQSLLIEYSLNNLFQLKINKNDLIIDCGANIGEFSKGIFKFLNNKNIICFEPDPDEFVIMEKNCCFSNLKHQKLGLSNVDGVSTFYLNNITGDSSIISDGGSTNKMSIQTVRLDNFINKNYKNKIIGILKVEAEGFEPEVLEGCENIFHKIKYITVDCGPERNGLTTFKEINDNLVKNNFSLINFNSTRMTLLYSNNILNFEGKQV